MSTPRASRLKSRTAALGIAAIFSAGLFLAFRQASGQTTGTWTPVNDPQAVTFVQMSPVLTPDTVSGWQTGAVIVDFQELAQDRFTGQYLQVVEFNPAEPTAEGTWVIQDLPILDPSVASSTSEMYAFATPMSGPAASTLVAAEVTPKPQAGAGLNQQQQQQRMQQILQQRMIQLQMQMFRAALNKAGLNVGGLVVSGLPDLPKNVGPIYDGTNNPANVDPVTPMDSVQQAVNQCGPGAVSNSLQYLIANKLLKDAKGDPVSDNRTNAQRMAAIDALTGRVPPAGVAGLPLMQGKLAYINNSPALKGNIEVKHMGWFCPTGNLGDPNCEAGNITVGKTTSAPIMNGGKPWPPTADFITAALKYKHDVELCFAFHVVQGTAFDGHCVHVVGYTVTPDNFLMLDVIQDAGQGGLPNGHQVAPKTLGHTKLKVGTDGTNLWITNLPTQQPALVTNVIGEGPMG